MNTQEDFIDLDRPFIRQIFTVGANRYGDFDPYYPPQDLPHADGWWWLAGTVQASLYNSKENYYKEVHVKDLALFSSH